MMSLINEKSIIKIIIKNTHNLYFLEVITQTIISNVIFCFFLFCALEWESFSKYFLTIIFKDSQK